MRISAVATQRRSREMEIGIGDSVVQVAFPPRPRHEGNNTAQKAHSRIALMPLESIVAASHGAVRLENELKKVIRGKDEVVRQVLVSVLARGHLLIEGVPGVGK